MKSSKEAERVLTLKETGRLLDGIPGLGMREPVAVIDRTSPQPEQAMVVERQKLLDGLNPEDPQDQALIKLLEPVEFPFYRVVLTDRDGTTYGLRICRQRRDEQGRKVGIA